MDILLRLRLLGQQSVQHGLNQTGNSAASMGRRAAAAGALAAGGLGLVAVAALDAAGDYEKSLNVFQAVSDSTAEEMKQVAATAKQLGADVKLPGTSAADAAVAMTELAKGGLSVKDAMAAARPVLQLSAAAQIGNAQAATITARALNTWSLAGTEADRVANLLAATANASTAEITDVAAGFQQAGASAANLGIPIDDLATALGVMANKGIAGSDAGTSLKTMMARLIPNTAKAKELMGRLGIDVFNAKGEFVGIRAAIQEYGAALKGKTQEERAAALETLFGSDAIRAANILLLSGTKSYDKMHKAVTRQGAAQKVADAQTKGFKGSLEAFKSTVETLAITWGEKLLPVATAVMRFLSANLEPAVNEVVAAIKATVAAVKDVVHWFEKHRTTTTILMVVLGSLTTMLTLYKAAVIATAIAQGVMAFSLGALGAAFGLVATAAGALSLALTANPIGVVVLALAGLTAGLVIAYKRSAAFRSAVNTVWGALRSAFEWVKANWPLILTILTGPFGLAFLVIKGNIDAIMGFIEARINNLIDLVNLAIKAFNALPFHGDVGLIGHVGGSGGSGGGALDRPVAARAAGGPVHAIETADSR